MHKKIRVDFCDFFLEKCDLIRGKSVGDIGIGGLVTLLAVHVGLDFDQLEEQPINSAASVLLSVDVLASMQLLQPNPQGGFDWLTGHPEDPSAKHPCFNIPHPIMVQFRYQNKNTWKPPFHYEVPTPRARVRRDLLLGEASGSVHGGDDDEEMEEEEHAHEHGGGEEGDEEEDSIPLSVYQQLHRLTTETRQNTTETRENTRLIREMQEHQRQMMYNQQMMMAQTHQMWSHFRPQEGYPEYPPYQPPPGGFPQFQPPPGGWPPYYPPPGGST